MQYTGMSLKFSTAHAVTCVRDCSGKPTDWPLYFEPDEDLEWKARPAGARPGNCFGFYVIGVVLACDDLK